MSSKTSEFNVALVALARSTFDMALAEEMTSRVRIALQNAGFTLTGPGAFVSNTQEAMVVSQSLSKALPDLLILLQATFADSTVAVHLAKHIDAPLLLWGLPEALTGGRLRLNSFCGINLAAHALRRNGYDYDYLYAPPEDGAAVRQVTRLARAGSVRRRLRQARIGRVGEHPEGFDSCLFNRETLKLRFGVDVVQLDLGQVFQDARRVDPQEVEGHLQQLGLVVDGLEDLDQTALRKTLASYVALRRMASKLHLDGMAIRCWPEFFTELGCAACGAMSLLSDERVPCSCEVDVNGTLTQLILQGMSGEPTFGSDLVHIDKDKDIAVLWHCGLAPLSMADPTVKPRGTIHSNRKLPFLMEFPLKPGRVTIARVSEASGDYRLVVGSGEIRRAPLSFSGTSGILQFDRPVSDVLDTIMNEGLEHHVSMTYGEVAPELIALAKMLGLPVVPL